MGPVGLGGVTRYRKCRPSGRKFGRHWDSLLVPVITAAGTPPAADTFWSPPEPSEKMITPSRFHVPPKLVGASHSVTGGPPDTSIFLSFPSAKNPRYRLS